MRKQPTPIPWLFTSLFLCLVSKKGSQPSSITSSFLAICVLMRLTINRHSNFTRMCYHRLMGAKIGKGVSLHEVQLGEWDLIEVQDGASLTKCICRPFAVEHNSSMYLGHITVGRKAVVGVSSVLAPGVHVPDDTCIGPNSSSWELYDAAESNRDLPFDMVPKPHWTLLTFATLPIYLFTQAVRGIPWLLGLLGLVMSRPELSRHPLLSILHWFAGHQRIGYPLLALALGTLFGPFFLFAVVLAAQGHPRYYLRQTRPQQSR